MKATGMPKDVKLQIAELNHQAQMAKLEQEQLQWTVEMQEELRVNTATIGKIAAEIENMRATTMGDAEDRQVAILNATLGALKTRNDVLIKQIHAGIEAMKLRQAEKEAGSAESGPNEGGIRRLVGAPGNSGAATGAAAAATGLA